MLRYSVTLAQRAGDLPTGAGQEFGAHNQAVNDPGCRLPNLEVNQQVDRQ